MPRQGVAGFFPAGEQVEGFLAEVLDILFGVRYCLFKFIGLIFGPTSTTTTDAAVFPRDIWFL
jgi:hypothetical protein